jgi:hypothetical protein
MRVTNSPDASSNFQRYSSSQICVSKDTNPDVSGTRDRIETFDSERTTGHRDQQLQVTLSVPLPRLPHGWRFPLRPCPILASTSHDPRPSASASAFQDCTMHMIDGVFSGWLYALPSSLSVFLHQFATSPRMLQHPFRACCLIWTPEREQGLCNRRSLTQTPL